MTKKTTDSSLIEVQNAVEQHSNTVQQLNIDIESLKQTITAQTESINTLSQHISELISQKEEKFWSKGFFKNLKSPNFFAVWVPAVLLFLWGIAKYGIVEFFKKVFT